MSGLPAGRRGTGSQASPLSLRITLDGDRVVVRAPNGRAIDPKPERAAFCYPAGDTEQGSVEITYTLLRELRDGLRALGDIPERPLAATHPARQHGRARTASWRDGGDERLDLYLDGLHQGSVWPFGERVLCALAGQEAQEHPTLRHAQVALLRAAGCSPP